MIFNITSHQGVQHHQNTAPSTGYDSLKAPAVKENFKIVANVNDLEGFGEGVVNGSCLHSINYNESGEEDESDITEEQHCAAHCLGKHIGQATTLTDVPVNVNDANNSLTDQTHGVVHENQVDCFQNPSSYSKKS